MCFYMVHLGGIEPHISRLKVWRPNQLDDRCINKLKFLKNFVDSSSTQHRLYYTDIGRKVKPYFVVFLQLLLLNNNIWSA